MKRLALAVAVCSFVVTGAAGAWAAAARFEALVIPGTQAVTAGFFRIDVSTGQVWMAWGNAREFAPTVDSARLPSGDYHLYPASTTTPDGKVTWTLNRMDGMTGRSWMATGGGNQRSFGMKLRCRNPSAPDPIQEVERWCVRRNRFAFS